MVVFGLLLHEAKVWVAFLYLTCRWLFVLPGFPVFFYLVLALGMGGAWGIRIRLVWVACMRVGWCDGMELVCILAASFVLRGMLRRIVQAHGVKHSSTVGLSALCALCLCPCPLSPHPPPFQLLLDCLRHVSLHTPTPTPGVLLGTQTLNLCMLLSAADVGAALWCAQGGHLLRAPAQQGTAHTGHGPAHLHRPPPLLIRHLRSGLLSLITKVCHASTVFVKHRMSALGQIGVPGAGVACSP